MSARGSAEARPITVPELVAMKRRGQKIVMVTAYDYLFARLADEAGIHVLLVGDSLGMVVEGRETTLHVTLEQTLYHTAMVRRGVRRALVVADMPFLTYQVSVAEAVRNCGRVLKETGAHAVKVEGGLEVVDTVRRLVEVGIPVMAHIGLTPQKVHRFGGFRVQGRTREAQKRLKEEALALQEAGAFSLVLESVPLELAREITEMLEIPTIGIGAGPYTDGQVLVLHDLLGLFEEFKPRFVKRYAHLAQEVRRALQAFKADVEQGRFPTEEHSFRLKPEEAA